VTVADPGALRVRRARAHKAGDHSLCRRCAAVSADSREVLAVQPRIAPVTDAESELRELAGLLAAAYRADPGNALLARELRMTLQALLPASGGQTLDGDLEELFAGLRT
jgi:hypothetical protein